MLYIKNNEGYITVKGKSFDGGVSRFEWEKQIDLDEALIFNKVM